MRHWMILLLALGLFCGCAAFQQAVEDTKAGMQDVQVQDQAKTAGEVAATVHPAARAPVALLVLLIGGYVAGRKDRLEREAAVAKAAPAPAGIATS